MSDDPMRILVVEPTKDPYVKEIDGSLESMQAIVGPYPYSLVPTASSVPPVYTLCQGDRRQLGEYAGYCGWFHSGRRTV